MTFEEFHDARLVALYDLEDPTRADTSFYLELASELQAESIIDIGCGTGAITCDLARRGHRMIGVDPAAAMLALARQQQDAELVEWIEGDARVVAGTEADLAIMTGHVAQVINDESSWQQTLATAHAALRPGGWLVFDSRNPKAQEWLRWTPELTRQRLESTPFGPVELWWQVMEVSGDLVRTEIHYHFEATDETLRSRNLLRFRSLTEISRQLDEAGFGIETVYGDWDRSPVIVGSPELIVVAQRR